MTHISEAVILTLSIDEHRKEEYIFILNPREISKNKDHSIHIQPNLL